MSQFRTIRINQLDKFQLDTTIYTKREGLRSFLSIWINYEHMSSLLLSFTYMKMKSRLSLILVKAIVGDSIVFFKLICRKTSILRGHSVLNIV